MKNRLEKTLKITAPEYKKLDLNSLSNEDSLGFFAEYADFTMRLFEELRPQLLAEQKLYVYDKI